MRKKCLRIVIKRCPSCGVYYVGSKKLHLPLCRQYVGNPKAVSATNQAIRSAWSNIATFEDGEDDGVDRNRKQ